MRRTRDTSNGADAPHRPRLMHSQTHRIPGRPHMHNGTRVVWAWKKPRWGGWCFPSSTGLLLLVVRRCPTLPHAPACSTIGAVRLSFRVRDGNRAFPLRYDHRNTCPAGVCCGESLCYVSALLCCVRLLFQIPHSGREQECVWSSPRLISTGQLQPLRVFHIRPINPVVSREP
jgi:hypothetical protein